MANRPTIGTGISNNLPCAGCFGTSCASSESCWHRTYNLGGDECKCFLEPGPTANDGTYPGWSGWSRKLSTQSTNTIFISTNNGEQIPVDSRRIAEIRYVDVNDNVNSISFPGYGKAQEITNYVMDANNIEPPSIIGLISSTKSARRIPIKVNGKYCRPCTRPLKSGCCGDDECWYMNGYGGQIGFMCQPPGIQGWPRPEESIAQLNISPFETQLQSSTMKNYLTEQKCVQTKNAAGQLIEKCS